MTPASEQQLWDNELEFLKELEPDRRGMYVDSTRKVRKLDFMGRPITFAFWARFDRCLAIALGLATGRA